MSTSYSAVISNQSDVPTANALWVGGTLTEAAKASLRSFVTVGQPIVLHAYEQLDVPKGVALADASMTVPKDRIFRHRASGSYAIFSDIFRYELLRRGADLWTDCDIYCLRPIPRRDYLYGWESDDQIGTGVLALPADSVLLKRMIEAATGRRIQPWVGGWAHRQQLRLRSALGLVRGARDLPWAATGPMALTYLAKEEGKDSLALPSDVLYPLSWRQVKRLLDPGLNIGDLVTPRSLCIHLYGAILHKIAGDVAPSSPLGQMLRA